MNPSLMVTPTYGHYGFYGSYLGYCSKKKIVVASNISQAEIDFYFTGLVEDVLQTIQSLISNNSK